MATPVWNTGYEHAILPTDAGAVTPNGNDGIYYQVTGSSPTLVNPGRSGVSGSRSLKVLPTTSAASAVIHRVGTASNVLVGRVYFQFDTLPDTTAHGDSFFVITVSSGTSLNFNYDVTSGGVQARIGAGTKSAASFSLSAGVWYRLEFLYDCSSTTSWVAHWQLAVGDGAATTQADPVSPTQTAATAPQWFTVGDPSTTSNYVIEIDDLLFSVTSGDYPLGAGYGVWCAPNADGTHNLSTDFQQSANGGSTLSALPSPAYPLVNARPATNGGTVAAQTTASTTTTGYLEFKFDTSLVLSAPNAVRVLSAIRNVSGTQANVISLKASDNGFSANKAIYTGFSIALATHLTYKCDNGTMAVGPSGSAWTTTTLAAATVRWGYSTDVSPVPTVGMLGLEVDQPPAAAPTTSDEYPYVYAGYYPT